MHTNLVILAEADGAVEAAIKARVTTSAARSRLETRPFPKEDPGSNMSMRVMDTRRVRLNTRRRNTLTPPQRLCITISATQCRERCRLRLYSQRRNTFAPRQRW